MDKFAADMGVDFAGTGVAAVSVWMGALRTERLMQMIASDPEKFGYLEGQCETPEFTGHVAWALYNDAQLDDRNGQTVIGAEMAVHYGLTDEGGRQPKSYRDTHEVAPYAPYPNIIR